jgi:signal peptidase I
MSENVQAAQSPEKSGAVSEIVEIVKTVVYALLIALVLRVLFFQPFTIPSASMEPNLYQGDYIIVSKFSYGY